MKPNLLRRQLFSATLALFAASALLAGHPAQAADDTLAALQKRGTLRVGIEGTYPRSTIRTKTASSPASKSTWPVPSRKKWA